MKFGALPFMEENYGFIIGRAVFIVPDIDEEKEALDMIVNFNLPLDWKVDSPWHRIQYRWLVNRRVGRICIISGRIILIFLRTVLLRNWIALLSYSPMR